MTALWNRAGHYIFVPRFLLSIYPSLFFFSSPILSRRRLDVYHILPHMMWPYCEFTMQVWNMLHAARWKIQDLKNRQKLAIYAPSHKVVGLCLRNEGMCRQSEKTC